MSATLASAFDPRAAATTSRTLRGQRLRDRGADAARRAGDECHFSGQVQHVAPGSTPAPPRPAAPHTRIEILGRANRRHCRVAVNLANQPAQHGARAHLNIRCDAIRRKAPDAFLPAHGRRHLPDERFDGRRSVAFRQRVDVRDDRHARMLRRHRAQLGCETILRRLHERAVERRAHRQRHDALRAKLLRPRACALDGRFRPGNHDLAGAVQVRRRDNLAVCRLCACLRDRVGIEAENRRHRTRADRHGLLHVASAPPDGAHRIGKRKRAGGDVGGVLAEAVARNERHGRRQPFGLEHAIRRDARRENRRLRVFRQHQRVFRPVPDQAAQRLAERLVRFGKHLPGRRKGLSQRAAHADLLRSLSWKHECNHETDAMAISCSTRCRKPAVENRWAMRMALRMAFADERPWQTKQTPATPSSGAPPYSE